MNLTKLIIIGVYQGTLSGIEQDKYYPSTETIMAIYTNFRADIHWILFNALKNDEVNLLSIYRNLKQQDQKEIIDYIDFKLKKS
ncbi:hypothetical protein [Paenibacillus sp. PL91]|uniref:hypothetical protein n=1 Tax=Paenibacillus sp. PL91 TaxID=2729538 RepID=UPI00145E8E30|nr:hypothetical protein [Paenibacillus sp. PL91]MBC9202941.1 hypothetical protein [Paenibacillus sp. PL91]